MLIRSLKNNVFSDTGYRVCINFTDFRKNAFTLGPVKTKKGTPSKRIHRDIVLISASLYIVQSLVRIWPAQTMALTAGNY